MLLAGDIGGTSTRLALVRIDSGRLVVVTQSKYSSQEHAGLGEIVARFIAEQNRPDIETACFGIAGAVRQGKVYTSNLPWNVDGPQLVAKLKLPPLYLLNDLEANAHGIPVLAAGDFVTLQAGSPDPTGNAAVISAGTGLGEAGIFFDGKCLQPFASEGGHSDFAPQDDLQAELLLYLKKKFVGDSSGHVSYERVLSGPGLYNIYQFLRDTGRGTEPAKVALAIEAGDPAAEISKAADAGDSELCAAAADLFVTFYGAEAGNYALKTLATRGVYIGGGIAPKIIDRLRNPRFVDAFCAKGRSRPLMEAMPVRVIMNDHAALLGAARYAAQSIGLLPPWTK